ncbi:MAG TPA: BACON domain-containing carbohydrate-binding protein [Blastocatellia bacterium]|nr:BACON domain-containing carbohydrate-binding protein [Blastocatellia bacterium]
MQNRTLFLKRAYALALGLSLLMTFSPEANADVPSQWVPRGPGGGGALFAPSFSPHDPNEVYISCDMSEVFRSTNLGSSWALTDFREIQGNRESQVRFTNNPSILYALDYTGDLAAPSKSTDGGVTWTRLTNVPNGEALYSLHADPNGASKLIVSDYSRIYLSTDGGSSFVEKFNTSSGNGCFVAGAFFDGNNVYVGTNLGLLVSANGGMFAAATVGGIPATEAMVSFAGARQGATVSFFCVTLITGDVFPGLFTEGSYFSYRGIYSLDLGQANWTKRVTGISASHFPFFVAMTRGNTSTAYVAGQADNEFPIVYKTTNGGTNWQSVLLTNNNQNIFTGWAGRGGDRDWSYGAGALGFAVSPTDANKAAFTDLGFAHITTDGGATWKQMYVNPADQNPMNALTPKGKAYHSVGLEDTTCWWLTWKDANNMFASYSDIRGTRSTDGGMSWGFNYAGQPDNSTYQSLKHAVSGTLYAATSTVHDMYQSTRLQDSILDGGDGTIKFSTDGGANWQTLHDFNHPVICLALDPNNANRMYASVIHSTQGGIYVSSNIQNGSSSTWTQLANPPRTEGHPFNIHVLNDGTLVCTYSGRRNSSGTFTASSGVFVSTNNGSTWVDRSHTNMRYWTKDVVIDPHDSAQNTWYVGVFSGWGGPPNGLGGLYKTTNRGQTWSRLNSLDRVTSCALSPVNPNEIYLTTETEGLWYSNNINAATPTFAAVTSYPFRQPERVFFNPFNPNEIWITSFGNGLRVGNACGYTLAPGNSFFPASGGSGSVSLSAAGGCGWTAASNDGWIIVTSEDNGAGPTTVTYEVRENFTGSPRTGTMTVAGQTFLIIQDGGLDDCTYTITPASRSLSSGGGAGNISVTAEDRCAWQAVSNVSWITIASGNMGIGNGTVNYSVAQNTTGLSRKGKITIGNQVFNVKQK